MSIVNEENTHEFLPVKVEVLERTKGEMTIPWKIIQVEIDNYECMSPPELRLLGRWLINQGNRIGREYKSNGARRK